MKLQTEFTFNEAKKEAVESLSALAKFAESLHDELLLESLEQWAIVLRTIEAEIRQASGRCLSDLEIEQVWRFGQQLIELIPDLKPQLLQLWELHQEVFGILRKKDSVGYALRGIISEIEPRIDEVDKLSYNIVQSAKGQVDNILSPASLLFVHIIRVESIENPIQRQLKDVISKFRLKNKYDPIAICSVNSKVPKGQGWRTDVRAIRDAAAHGRFRIKAQAKGWSIEFHNNERGYEFDRCFSHEEFLEFFDLHTLLYKLQLHLLILLEVLPILATHLRRQQRKSSFD